MTRRLVGDAVLALSMVSGTLSGWLTWTLSGSAERNSYASLRSAQRLGIEELTPLRVVWFCVPVAALGMLLLLLARRRLAAAAGGVIVGLVLVGFGTAVLLTPVASGVGPWLACLSGGMAVVGSIVQFAQGADRS